MRAVSYTHLDVYKRQVSEGGPRLWDVSQEHIPADVKPEIETGLRAFELVKASPATLDWFYVSPPADFGSCLLYTSRCV